MSYNFDLSHKEFYNLLKNDNQRLEELPFAHDISFVYKMAISDCRLDVFLNSHSGIWLDRKEMESKIRSKLEGNSLYEIRKLDDFNELRELGVYLLAIEAVPWKDESSGSIPEELKHLKEKVVPKDTWGTFINFHEALRSISYDSLLIELLAGRLFFDMDIKIPPFNVEDFFDEYKKDEYERGFTEEKINAILSWTTDLKEQTTDVAKFLVNQLASNFNITHGLIVASIVISILAWVF